MVRFGEFELDVRAGELRRNQQKLRLQEQPYRILAMLLEQPGEVVLREDICKRLWPNGTVVEASHGINAAVLRLRDALGDTADNPRFVETVARRGYRFLAPVAVECRSIPARRDIPPDGPSTDAFAPGQPMAHFRLEEKLGRGGMGVVYRAEDLNLGRPVALKFLAPEMAGDALAVGRFQREARTASALNHPNICTVYAVEECAGQPVIVMELIEGRTLESVLPAGPVAAETALPLAIQMAAALDAAHHKGIVHRDLKPANVMLTQFGLKVLDFGLAKRSVSGESPAKSGVTAAGSILGTPNYMAPELFHGKEADARSDIYSFGLVLYEMVTGSPPAASSLQRLPASAIDLEPVVRRALEANPRDRWQSAGDLKAALECIAAARASRPPAATAVSRGRKSPRRGWIPRKYGIAAAVCGMALPAYWFSRPFLWKDPAPGVWPAAASARPAGGGGNPSLAGLESPFSGRMNLSPDGRFLAYSTTSQIDVRDIDTNENHLLVSGAGAVGTPFWSPDGESVAFTRGGRLFTVSRTRALKPIGEINTNIAGAWGPDGTILIGDMHGGLVGFSASGGPARKITTPDAVRGETRHLLPQFLPGGRKFLYTAATAAGAGTLYAGSLDSADRVPIMPIESGATFVPAAGARGYLVFDREGYLLAQAFNSETLATEGEPFPIAGPVRGSAAASATGITVADASVTPATLVYRSSARSSGRFSLISMLAESALGASGDVIVLRNWMPALKK